MCFWLQCIRLFKKFIGFLTLFKINYITNIQKLCIKILYIESNKKKTARKKGKFKKWERMFSEWKFRIISVASRRRYEQLGWKIRARFCFQTLCNIVFTNSLSQQCFGIDRFSQIMISNWQVYWCFLFVEAGRYLATSNFIYLFYIFISVGQITYLWCIMMSQRRSEAATGRYFWNL